jgi:hypothetical protein
MVLAQSARILRSASDKPRRAVTEDFSVSNRCGKKTLPAGKARGNSSSFCALTWVTTQYIILRPVCQIQSLKFYKGILCREKPELEQCARSAAEDGKTEG